MNELLNIEEFIIRFKKIKEMGWVKTHRSGTTGIGKTLEDLLGVKENNIQGPDFGIYELKSKRINAQSMLTLITKSPILAPALGIIIIIAAINEVAGNGNTDNAN